MTDHSQLELEIDVDSIIAGDEVEDITTINEGMTLDYITQEPIKDTAKEQVRQRIARALLHEYGLSVDDMEPGFRLKVDGRSKQIDLAIFDSGTAHTEANLRRIVMCDKEPTKGKKGAVTMRDHDQAAKDVAFLKSAMAAAEHCKYGLWTNGLEFFFFEKEITRFDVKFNPIGDWPMADETMGTRDIASAARLRQADREMLLITFRRCHNFIHGNEGMPKDAAFWQFLYLIFAKMHDEKRSRSIQPRFWAGAEEQFNAEGRKAIRARIEPLFEEVKQEYSNVFRGNEEITLSDRALAFLVSELSRYDFMRTEVDRHSPKRYRRRDTFQEGVTHRPPLPGRWCPDKVVDVANPSRKVVHGHATFSFLEDR